MSMAGLIAGADGVMVEVHTDPDNALSDADQTIDINQYRALVSRIKNMY
jgi:3-deoxy-7-phosphoheptulonate synthase